MVLNIVADLVFIVITLHEGLEYVEKTWRPLPILVVAWAIAWLCLQVPPVLALRNHKIAQLPATEGP